MELDSVESSVVSVLASCDELIDVIEADVDVDLVVVFLGAPKHYIFQ